MAPFSERETDSGSLSNLFEVVQHSQQLVIEVHAFTCWTLPPGASPSPCPTCCYYTMVLGEVPTTPHLERLTPMRHYLISSINET